jgi:hypothetical protein
MSRLMMLGTPFGSPLPIPVRFAILSVGLYLGLLAFRSATPSDIFEIRVFYMVIVI